MNKNLILAGVSAAALALSAGSAFAFFNANSNSSAGGTDATTNAAANNSTIANATGNNSSTDNSNQNNENNTQKNADLSVNQDNRGTIGDHNTKVDVNVRSFTLNDDDSKNETNSFAADGNEGAVASSALGAIIAKSDVDFKPASGVVYDGNLVSGSYANAAGIAGVNQNDAINANNQQSVTVAAGAIAVNTLR